MTAVLVLNATYEPISIVSQRRAVVLLLKNKAEIVEAAKERLRAARLSLPVPLVIRLVYYVRVPHRSVTPLTRRAVYLRDEGTCQYCGQPLARHEMTVDHVLPRIRGGVTDWENVVCACQRCNTRKGSRTPEEAGMPLRRSPYRPRYSSVVLASYVQIHDSWSPYIYAAEQPLSSVAT
ncbi:MAG: HNH endonuclease [Anaerolineae bacterium]|jgi:5-methylcytosine-specific restriction endonuclease McrA|nr:HNH endonuclease [Chloroflexota bacterium]